MKVKGSDKVEMTINIGGEFLKLNAGFDEQIAVRDAEFAVKQYYNKLKKSWPDSTDSQILAMAAYQFAFWYKELLDTQNKAIELANKNSQLIEETLSIVKK